MRVREEVNIRLEVRVVDYVLNRLVQVIPVLFLASLIVFLIMRAAPGDPAQILAGDDATPEQVEIVRRSLGLDRPLVVQYTYWLWQIFRGNLGTSMILKRPVTELIRLMFPATLELATAGLFLMVLIGIPTGIVGAVRHGSLVDRVLSAFTALGLAIPVFWLGILAILLFAVRLRWLPPAGRVSLFADPREGLRHLCLPAVTLAIPNATVLSRFVKASLLEELGEDYVRTARSKGLRETVVICRHALRNAFIPVVTVLAITLGRFLGGSVVIETVFAWPGLGRLIAQAISYRDYPLVQGLLLFFVTVFVFTNLLTDMAYGILDPRIRLRAS